jgi:FixJ family two-component response regulator
MVRRTNRRRIARGRNTRTTTRTRSARYNRTTPTRSRSTRGRKSWNFKPWTPQEIKTLRKIYRDTPTKEVAKKLGRSVSSIQGKAGDLGLRKTAAYMKKMRQGWF